MSSHGGGGEQLFAGVCFVLVGFDSVSESQYRSEMVRRGGADAGRYDASCTHVVVCGRVYDDPVCAAARNDGKKLVTELWVDDSLDLGTLADADRVIYRPVRDLNGIPGSESLHICLTGYQRNGREDIMKMVSLMGAQFSKPLIANQVTHLICYKFEGEKYELAKRVNIKLVNHRWLEDCLKAWEILPIDDYTKSGWELEIMEAQAKDSEDEAGDADRRSFNSRASVKSTPITKNGMATIDPGARTPNRTPICPTGDREVVSGKHLNTPNQIRKDEVKSVGTKTLDIRTSTQGTNNTSGATVSAHCNVLPSMGTSTILSDSIKTAAGRCLDNPDQIDPSSALLTTPSRENWSAEMNSSNISSKLDHNSFRGDLNATAGWSNVDNLKSGGNAALGDIHDNLSYSRKHLQKSVSPEGAPVHQAAYPQSAEGNMLCVDSNLSPVGKRDQKLTEPADMQSPEEDEMMKRVDGSGGAHAQNSKALLSSVSPKLPKGDPGSETANSFFDTVESAASEPATTSSLGRSSVGTTKVNSRAEAHTAVNFTEKQQQSVSFKSKLSSYRRASLKHVRPVEGVKHPEHSANDKNVESPGKASALPETMTKNKCSASPSTTAEVEKQSTGFSRNVDMEDAQLSAGNAVSHSGSLLMYRRTGKDPTKDKAPDISLCSSKNSELVSIFGNAENETTDAPDINKNELVSCKPEHDKVISHENVETGPKNSLGTANAVQTETSSPKKVSAYRVRKAGVKRPRNASTEMDDGSVANKSDIVASKSEPDKMICHEHVEGDAKMLLRSATDVECRFSPKKVPTSRVRNAVTRMSRDVDIEVSDAQIAPKSELGKVISPEENTERDPKRLSSSASANEYQRSSPRKVPSTRVRNTAANGSLNADIGKIDAPVDKTETVGSKSWSEVLVPPENVEAYPKRLSSSGSADGNETCSPNEVPTNGVRNAVAKRKMKSEQEKSGRIVSVIASLVKAVSSKRIDESSSITNKVAADQDMQKANEDEIKDVPGSFCKDIVIVEKSELLNSKSRSRKRNKTVNLMDMSSDHEKENRPDHGSVSPKSKDVNGIINSKCSMKAVESGTDVLSKHSRTQGNGCGPLVTSDPAWFILSGHRLQRREYRSMLRRLKGRVCRDSHHWSYQATHFIAPDPLRRTEKFFAAAAAGRWILKTDYLTACNKAGMFLEEEPFEWYGTGLNDGDTISLDAPRKWRRLRQQTGHGALYGTQIIVYGPCISPSLDTLKRAIRAGDGTILATSPPYTRFLKSSVDFAVVSASMPSADAWVQEFGKHNIPCISADYLVEYVCKPGYPLNKHVLFKMHDLAEKSREKLLKKQQEVLPDTAEPLEEGSVDLSCSVCGSNDREDVMLLCGDEDSAAGCGVGMHIDCCDPPLEAVPDGEWLCPKCDVPKAPKKTKNGAKSRVSKRR